MSLYLVSSETQQAALDRAIAAMPGARQFHHRLWFIPYTGTAQELTLKLVDDPTIHRAGLVVIRVEADYYGFSKTPNWDWLGAAFRGEVNG